MRRRPRLARGTIAEREKERERESERERERLFRKKPSSEFSFIIASKVTITACQYRVNNRHQHKL